MVVRRRYRTIHVARLDRLMAEAEAIRRALAAGARWARVASSSAHRRLLRGRGAWEVVLRIGAQRRRRKGNLQGNCKVPAIQFEPLSVYMSPSGAAVAPERRRL